MTFNIYAQNYKEMNDRFMAGVFYWPCAVASFCAASASAIIITLNNDHIFQIKYLSNRILQCSISILNFKCKTY